MDRGRYKLTVIICATDICRAYNVCHNIEKTFKHADCQFLICDNTCDNKSIAEVYNRYASISNNNNILFVHQDVEFVSKTSDADIQLLSKLNESTTGCIGFAGSRAKLEYCYSGWYIDDRYASKNFYQRDDMVHQYMCINKPFDEVVILDGLAILTKRDLVLTHQFDIKTIKKFHCYDIDFTLELCRHNFKNYVYTSQDFSVVHDSRGNYNKDWFETVINLTNTKWSKICPIKTDNARLLCIDDEDIRKRANHNFLTKMRNNNCEQQLFDKLIIY